MNRSITKPAVVTSVNLNGRLIEVPFESDRVLIVDHDGQPYVVMKALSGALGLAWQPQHTKMVEKFGATVTEIVTVADDGKTRSMTCLPLRKLPGWLYSINPGKVAAELRTKIRRYQEQCDEVLWNFWTGTYVPQHQVESAVLSRIALSYEREHTRVCLELAKCSELGLADALYDKYQRLCGMLSARVVSLESLAPALKQKRLALEGGAA